ncbi:MAG: HAMP domain-containing histidine kinase [Polyangiaceae bacterium]|nr:HAMP domain-containing histidine kinase [Polyangiaceae bacterium]
MLDATAQSLRAAQIRGEGAASLRIRPVIVGPGMLVITTALWMSGEPRQRLVVTAASLFVMFSFFCSEAIFFRRRELTEGYLLTSMLITLFGLNVVCAGTGGLNNPVLVLLFAPTGVGLAAFGTGPSGHAIVRGLLVSLVLLALFGELDHLPAIASPIREVMTVGSTIVCGVLLYFAVGKLSDAYLSAGGALHRTRQTLLDEATLRARDLEAVGGRVAHELKNPLAAGKGFFELVRKNSDDSRQSERLDVAISELERMNVTLGDCLAFSKPLAALALEAIALQEWIVDLVAASEGSASAAGISLSHSCPALLWTADRPRLWDALSNLLNNALAACRHGDEVSLRCELEDEALRIVVSDSGEGVQTGYMVDEMDRVHG